MVHTIRSVFCSESLLTYAARSSIQLAFCPLTCVHVGACEQGLPSARMVLNLILMAKSLRKGRGVFVNDGWPSVLNCLESPT